MFEVGIGTKGESYFVERANQYDLLAHNTGNGDQNGWDFLVEHPLEAQALLAAPIRIKSFVQVKTTSPKYKQPVLKLNALIKLVQTPEPTFVVHLHHDGKRTTFKGLYHINDTIMQIAQQKYEQRKGNENPNVNFLQNWRIRDVRSMKDFDRVAKRICAVAGGYGNYVTNKISQVENAGFETEELQVTYHPACVESTANFRAAKSTSFDLTSITLNRSRFGVLQESNEVTLSGGRLEFVRDPDFLGTAKISVDEISIELDRQRVFQNEHDDGTPYEIEIENDFFDFSVNLETKKQKLLIKDVTRKLSIETIEFRLRALTILHDPRAILQLDNKGVTALRVSPVALEKSENPYFHPYMFTSLFSRTIHEISGPQSFFVSAEEIHNALEKNFEAYKSLFDMNAKQRGKCEVGDMCNRSGVLTLKNLACNLDVSSRVLSLSKSEEGLLDLVLGPNTVRRCRLERGPE